MEAYCWNELSLSYYINIFIMQIKKQQSPTKSTQLHKQATHNQQQKIFQKTFSNPICKQTFSALPHIYGKKQPKVRAHTEPTSEHKSPQKKTNAEDQRRFSLSMLQHHNKQKRQLSERAVRLSIPKHRAGCTKKSCVCQKQIEKQKIKKKKTTYVSTLVGHIRLPEIQNFDTDDLQSSHKVLLKTTTAGLTFSKTGLQSIVNEKQKIKSKANTTPSPKKKQSIQKMSSATQKQVYTLTKVNFNLLKTKHKMKAKFNHERFDIQQQSQEQNQIDYQNNQKNKINRKFSFTYRGNPSMSNRSQEVILNQSRFKSANVHYSTSTHLNAEVKKNKKAEYSSKSNSKVQSQNGLFIIPDQQHYLEYLKNYQKINMNFNLRQLVKKPTFCIQKSNNQVYFGQIDEQGKKHGQGITITTKSVYEGKYENNSKLQGCERNGDGVYVGTYINDLRSGYGVFRWYNGQYFQGNWENGVKNGFGVWRSPKGDYYEGQWEQNKQQGKGLFRHRTSTYRGQFKNFLKHGLGQQIFANGDRYKGFYYEGKPHGRGRYQWQDGGYYQGTFAKGMREGKGKWMVPKCFAYEGSFKQDFKHGFGKQSYPSGQIYEGQFMEGKRTNGRLISKNKSFKQIKRNESAKQNIE